VHNVELRRLIWSGAVADAIQGPGGAYRWQASSLASAAYRTRIMRSRLVTACALARPFGKMVGDAIDGFGGTKEPGGVFPRHEHCCWSFCRALHNRLIFPAAKKSWETDSTDNLSLKMFLTLTVGVATWIIYGVLQRDSSSL
jgi:hypothetical protein